MNDLPPPIPDDAAPDMPPAPIPPVLQPQTDSEPPPVTAAPDPWAHRRGEPRIFAFCWMMYILFAVAGSVAWVASSGVVSPSSYGPAARIMLVVVAIGATVLWPMVRLSQQSPNERATSAIPHVLADAVIVLVPIQLIAWPLLVLANWPVTIVAAVAATLAAWVGVSGGLLTLALSGPVASRPNDPALGSRTLWMSIILAFVLAGPLATFAINTSGTPAPRWLAMLSPVTAIPTLTGVGISGPQNPVSHEQLRIISITAILALVLWLAAGVRPLLGGRSHAA